MRLKPSICSFIVCCALAYSYPVGAQEGRPQPEMDAIGVKSDPDPVLSESESKNNKLSGSATIAKESPRDSVQIKSAKAFKPTEKVEKEEQDPLSFNFLYYIIEKYKMSDIIE